MDLAALLSGGLGGAGAGMGQGGAGGGVMVEFRAGRCTRQGKTVTSDKRKGMVRLFKGADQVLHFAWKQRNKQELELDLMLFPGDAECFMVPQPPATGRVFALRVKGRDDMHFFWIQEPKDEKDAENIKNMNIQLGNEPAPDVEMADAAVTPATTIPAAPAATAEEDEDEDGELAAALAMSMEGAGAEGAETPAAAAPAVTPAAPAPKGGAVAAPAEEEEEDAELAAALAMSMEGAGAPESAAPAAPAAPAQDQTAFSPALQNLLRNIQSQAAGVDPGLDLSSVLDTSVLSAVALDEEVQADLLQHMPEGLQTQGELVTFITSPQFQQTVASLSHVLDSAQMYQVLGSMGVEPAMAKSPGVGGFLQALVEACSKKKAEAPPEDDDMDADLYD